MSTVLWEFRDLFVELREQTPSSFDEDLLLPWLDARPRLAAELRDVGRPDSHRVRIAPDREHWTVLEGLYALSRVIDVLIAPHQPAAEDAQQVRLATPTAWPAFIAAIRATPIAESSFHPFFHEIVSVQASDDPDEVPALVAEYWPGAMVGGLLLARAGVGIRAGANIVDATVGAHSCMYWTWRRRNRVTHDLSHGWGSNSQWRTNFRRDYLVDGDLHYNVDAAGGDRDELSAEDRRTLLRYRCSTRTDLGEDQWPYDETLVELTR